MFKHKSLPFGTMAIILVISLALLGVGYGLWSQVLTIQGQVNTGNLAAAFTRSFSDDDGTVNDANLDSNDDGACDIQAGGETSCDPAANGPDPKDRHEKDVASCVTSISSDGTVGRVTKNGAYPGYFCTAWFEVENQGSVPVRIASAQINGEDVLPFVPTTLDLNEDNEPDVTVELTGFDICQQVDPNNGVLVDVDQEILQGIPQGSSLSYTVELQLNQWNEECAPPSLPAFNVAATGLTDAEASRLGSALGIPSDELVHQDGMTLFVDPQNFQAAPMATVGDFQPAPNEDGVEVVAEGFDFDALAEIQPMSGKEAIFTVQSALQRAEVVVGTFTNTQEFPAAVHSNLQVVNTEGETVADALLDTHVRHSFSLAGVPMIGPGAQFNVAFAPDGQVTGLTLAAPSVQPGDNLPLLPAVQAARACEDLALGGSQGEASIDPVLTYYAPDPALGAEVILPHYDCGGTIQSGDNQAILLQRMVPAVDDPRFVPQVALQVSNDGNLVEATASVEGGKPPYSFSWTATSADLSDVPEDQSSVEYEASPRTSGLRGTFTEKVVVVVTDANGISSHASQTVEIPLQQIGSLMAGPNVLAAPFFVPGRVDFGIERAVSDMCANNVNRYSNRMDNEATKQFHWTGQTAWERDFKQGGSGLDHIYTDNVDETFYCGHGWGGGFTFESSQDDGSIVPGDVNNAAWGSLDLEFMALLSCQVLKGDHNGQSWAQRWGPAFGGLHLLMGFETNAYDWGNFGKTFAQYQMGRNFGFIEYTLPVRAAWFQAANEKQPSGVRSVVMGVVGPSGLSNYNDFFHGEGPMGPDIRGSDIRGYWRVTYTVP